MPVTATKPSGGSGAALWRARAALVSPELLRLLSG